ncbi:glycosyltransferase family 39 protein [bacterium]|nr:glycosyltransferase family 39 protein [bacterium]
MVVILVVNILLRFWVAVDAPYNEDETDLAHWAWMIAEHDATLFVDWWDQRAPIPFYANALLEKVFDEDGAIIVKLRLVHVVLAILTLALYAMTLREAMNTTVAGLALALSGGLWFAVSRMSQVRHDVWMHFFVMLFWWTFVRYRAGASRFWLGAAAVAGALAVHSKQTGAFPVLGLAVFFLIDAVLLRRSWRDVIHDGLVFAGIFLATVAALFVAVGGTHVGQVLAGYFYSPALVRHYELENATHWTSYLRYVFVICAPLWVIVVGGLVGIARRSFRAGGADVGAYWLSTFLTTQLFADLASLLPRGTFFEQDLIMPALIGMAAAALWFDTSAKGTPLSRIPTKAGVAILLLITLGPLLYGAFHDWRNLQQAVFHHKRLLVGYFVEHPPEKGDPNIALAQTNLWKLSIEDLAQYFSGPYDKVHYYPGRYQKQQREIIYRLLQGSRPDQPVFTDDNTQIFRYAGHRVVRARVLEYALRCFDEHPDLAEKTGLCRIQPEACIPGLSPAQRMRKVLEHDEPAMIVLGYTTSRLLLDDPLTRQWVDQRYRFGYYPDLMVFMGNRREELPPTL